MDVDDEDLENNLDPDTSAMQEPDSEGKDFVACLAQITGDRERMVVAIVPKGSKYIAATVVEDEWMQDRQDLITYQGRGAPAAGRGSGRVVLLLGRGRGRGQRSEASIALPRKVCTTSCDCASNCWIEEPGKAPHTVRIPTSAEEILSGGPLAVDMNSRRKRIRNSSCASGASLP